MKISTFEYIKKHKGCKHRGKLMKCSTQFTDDTWVWCNGRTWIPPDPDNPNKLCNYFEYCEDVE